MRFIEVYNTINDQICSYKRTLLGINTTLLLAPRGSKLNLVNFGEGWLQHPFLTPSHSEIPYPSMEVRLVNKVALGTFSGGHGCHLLDPMDCRYP